MSLHFEENGGHLDLFLDPGEERELLTFGSSQENLNGFLNGCVVEFEKKRSHRREYLEYEGSIPQRGRIEIVLRGKYRVDELQTSEKVRLKYREGKLYPER
ncbi:hypothetical protein [Leptospira stimsonii]|uniref:Uncharacterized protein n=1 Tax=Leptospira stimsonii TaxID=2202203 RepID=A0A4R9KZL9_9LEPT|nr:hypothetical protein [Leptospira stimsonii]RHX88121.1 hypothetical protein DLM78_03970 [Leptospira stimsonii]TGK23830.1 hypothetical protein EHO98_03990 [Leptospira stimsonii]TGM10462.1 hypothetical protein EHQ90_18530 [Leptospira stimsonii]